MYLDKFPQAHEMVIIKKIGGDPKAWFTLRLARHAEVRWTVVRCVIWEVVVTFTATGFR